MLGAARSRMSHFLGGAGKRLQGVGRSRMSHLIDGAGKRLQGGTARGMHSSTPTRTLHLAPYTLITTHLTRLQPAYTKPWETSHPTTSHPTPLPRTHSPPPQTTPHTKHTHTTLPHTTLPHPAPQPRSLGRRSACRGRRRRAPTAVPTCSSKSTHCVALLRHLLLLPLPLPSMLPFLLLLAQRDVLTRE